MLDPERPVEPRENPMRPNTCPICGADAHHLYLDSNNDVFGCELCVQSDLIDDIMQIPETEPLPTCPFCGKQEQTVYMDKTGKIRACWQCVTIQP